MLMCFSWPSWGWAGVFALGQGAVELEGSYFQVLPHGSRTGAREQGWGRGELRAESGSPLLLGLLWRMMLCPRLILSCLGTIVL